MAYDNEEVVAGVSLGLYSTLFLMSLVQFLHHIRLYKDGIGGRYIDHKLLFFGVLTASSALDIPIWLGCVALGGPKDCAWPGASFPVFWAFHLVSLIGYAVCITVPPLLWDDILNYREGKMLFSEWPKDRTRTIFCVCIVLYVIAEIITVTTIILYYKTSDPNSFRRGKHKWVSTIGVSIEPVLILVLAGWCLFCGVKLQLHVMSIGLAGDTQRRLLVQLNIVLTAVVLSYLTRAVLVLSLAYDAPTVLKHAVSKQFFPWTLATRWLPHIICSMCLWVVMSRSSKATGMNGYGIGTSEVFLKPADDPWSMRVESTDDDDISATSSRRDSARRSSATAGSFGADGLLGVSPQYLQALVASGQAMFGVLPRVRRSHQSREVYNAVAGDDILCDAGGGRQSSLDSEISC